MRIDNLRWNKILIFIDPIFFINGMVFLSLTTTIPYFLLKFNASNIHISIANLFLNLGVMIPSLFFANYVQRLKRRGKIFTNLLLIQRTSFLLYVLLIPYFSKFGDIINIYLFLVFWGVFCIFVGSYGPFYFSILDSVIPYEERGNILGISYSVSGIISLLSSYVLNIYLTKFSFPYNFMYIFLTGILILIMDAFLFGLIREPERSLINNSPLSLRELMSHAKELLAEDKNFRNLIISFLLLLIATTSLPYHLVFITKTFKTTSSIVSQMALISAGVNILGNLLFGRISKRYGNRITLIVGNIIAIIGILLNLILKNFISSILCYAFIISLSNAYMLGGGLLITNIAKKDILPFYISINTIITTIFSSLLYLLNAKIIDILGFRILIGLGLFGSLFSLLILLRKVKEVR